MQGTFRRGQAMSGGLSKTNPWHLNKHQGENRQNICGKASTGVFNIVSTHNFTQSLYSDVNALKAQSSLHTH